MRARVGQASCLPAGRMSAPLHGRAETGIAKCLFAGECLHCRISSGVERAREALARLLLSEEALRETA